MTHSITYEKQREVFNADWLYTKILNETIEAEIEVFKLRNETKNFLTRVEEDTQIEKRQPPRLL